MNKAPLEDPSYKPEHPPVEGKIPEAVIRFGPETQLRWFKRFLDELHPGNRWNDYYVSSRNHKGLCCSSCLGEFEDGYQGGGVIASGQWCCCYDVRPV